MILSSQFIPFLIFFGKKTLIETCGFEQIVCDIVSFFFTNLLFFLASFNGISILDHKMCVKFRFLVIFALDSIVLLLRFPIYPQFSKFFFS